MASAIGLKIRKADTDVPAAPDEPAPPGREGGRTASFFADVGAYASESSEISVIEGNFNERGPGSAWIRLKGPVIAGQEPTPIERVAAAADFGNGVSSLTGNDRSWLFINPDLTIQLARPPVGEWIHLESRSQMHPSGTGLAVSRLADTEGWLGASAQSLLVDRIRGQQSGSDQ